MPKINDICILGAGIGGLVSLLTALKKFQEDGTVEVPKITLIEKRTEDDFDVRPQLIVINDLGVEKILIELIGEAEYNRICAGGTMHIGELQRVLWQNINAILAADPKLKEAVTIKFDTQAQILDMPTGIVRHRANSSTDEHKWHTHRYGLVINATGRREDTKELAQSHGVKFKKYHYQERTPYHAAAMFFLPGAKLPEDKKIPYKPNIPAKILAELGWDRKEQPNIYIISKATDSGIVFSIVGEFPNIEGYTEKNVEQWMQIILRLTLEQTGVASETLKIMEATDDPSLARYTNQKLALQVFPMEMEHIESTVYHDESRGDSVSLTIGNASSSANPHLASGGVLAILQGSNVGQRIAGAHGSDMQSLNSHFQSMYDGLSSKMKGQQWNFGYTEIASGTPEPMSVPESKTSQQPLLEPIKIAPPKRRPRTKIPHTDSGESDGSTSTDDDSDKGSPGRLRS